MKLEEYILKQKTQLQWFKYGDANSRYFHSLMRERRRKLFIHKIKDIEGEWVQGDEAIWEATCDYYQDLFTETGGTIREDLLSSGPDGLNGKFFQSCWDIIKVDLLQVVLAFFGGSEMPKYITSACLVFLPKVEFSNSFTEYRPIRVNNFVNKIISKVICSRLGPILPRIISPNQSGFVKGRSISENIMLAQKIVQGIKNPNKGSNVVIKLNMEKAYDRVSWSFTCIMLRRMGFNERIIDMIWRTISNN
uniref:Reverse transcriptase domain-containing protein n=1 Tax=Nicotiana tabacum TaxID=4097 RepID=A0A1S4D900_TOBAC|nr:PREDICTED: uncharacterized protein LOC107827279 [Nicotiana tabacum]